HFRQFRHGNHGTFGDDLYIWLYQRTGFAGRARLSNYGKGRTVFQITYRKQAVRRSRKIALDAGNLGLCTRAEWSVWRFARYDLVRDRAVLYDYRFWRHLP